MCQNIRVYVHASALAYVFSRFGILYWYAAAFVFSLYRPVVTFPLYGVCVQYKDVASVEVSPAVLTVAAAHVTEVRLACLPLWRSPRSVWTDHAHCTCTSPAPDRSP